MAAGDCGACRRRRWWHPGPGLRRDGSARAGRCTAQTKNRADAHGRIQSWILLFCLPLSLSPAPTCRRTEIPNHLVLRRDGQPPSHTPPTHPPSSFSPSPSKDVRTAEAYSAGHVECAVNIPRPTFTNQTALTVTAGSDSVDEVMAAVGGNQSFPIYVYCYAGHWRSTYAP